MIDEDQQLFLKAMNKGNHQAFTKLYYRYQDFLAKKIRYGKFAQHVQRETEDITQEIWEKIFITKNYNPNFSFKTFLVRVCRNYCIDLIRKTGHSPINNSSVPIDGEDFNEMDIHSKVIKPLTTEEIVILEQKQKHLLTLLSQLNESEREIFFLRTEGMSYEEIAEAMELNTHQVIYSLKKAINELNTLLRNH